MTAQKSDVSAYWDARPCVDGLTEAERGSQRYFVEVEEAKNQLEPYVHSFAEFSAWAGREVLEVGCGLGTDAARFARGGARITAVDLTEVAVELTRAHIASEGLGCRPRIRMARCGAGT